MTMLFAALYGENFGRGRSELAAVENALVLFMLALFFGTLLIAGALILLARRERDRSLPRETKNLLHELQDEDPETWEPPSDREEEDSETVPRDPWEQDPDWWKKS